MSRLLILALTVAGLCGGCATLADPEVQRTALPELAKLAAPVLRDIAKQKGIHLDERYGACFEVPTDAAEDLLPEDWPVAVVVVICAAPELTED